MIKIMVYKGVRSGSFWLQFFLNSANMLLLRLAAVALVLGLAYGKILNTFLMWFLLIDFSISI